MRARLAPPAGLALLVLLLSTAAAGAAEPPPLLAGAYWEGFKSFWLGGLQKQNGMVLLGLALGTVCILIIVKGKWKK